VFQIYNLASSNTKYQMWIFTWVKISYVTGHEQDFINFVLSHCVTALFGGSLDFNNSVSNQKLNSVESKTLKCDELRKPVQSEIRARSVTTVTPTVFYFCFRLHDSWYRYTIRFSFSTFFGLMGPSSGILGLTITYFIFCYSPYTGQCLHIGSAVYSFYASPVLRNKKCMVYL
jgi:hypothetical protein